MGRFLLLLMIVAAGCTMAEKAEERYSTATVVIANSQSQKFTFNVEVPLTQQGFLNGLMFRESLEDDRGMLFQYEDSAHRSFWMKNTLIPLDMIFIDENLVIRKIHHAVPCNDNPCVSYKSGVPVKYVLEVRGNLTREKNINEGDFAELKLDEKR